MEETLVLNDASKEDAVVELLDTLDLSGVDSHVEIALDYPSQQLAVDLYAGTREDLSAAVETVRAALEDQLRVAAATSSELEHAAMLNRTA